MTSTPVKDVGSLLNFVGSKNPAPAAKQTGADSFGDVMSKTSYGNRDSLAQTQTSAGKTASGKAKEIGTEKVNQLNPRKDNLKTKSTEEVKTKEQGPVKDEEQAVQNAGETVVKETAKELGVSEEEVVDAMEELGFGVEALLDANNLTQLVLTLSGEENSLALLTDEGLYGKVQNLLQILDTTKQELAEELSLTPEEFETVLAGVNTEEIAEREVPVQEAFEELPAFDEKKGKISVTVEEGTQSVKMSADENGNVIQVEEVVKKEDSTQENNSGSKGNTKDDKAEHGLEHGSSLMNEIQRNQPQNVEAPFEQMTASASPETREIMDQILDYMKVQIKPEMDQLEMQLHPASLGTLKIQLTSKGGEVTAQFHVQNETVKAAIEGQLSVLKDTLREQGVKVEAVEVTVESHAFESNLWQGQGNEEQNAYQGNKKAPRRINLDALQDDFEEEASEEEILAAEMMRANGQTVDYTA